MPLLPQLILAWIVVFRSAKERLFAERKATLQLATAREVPHARPPISPIWRGHFQHDANDRRGVLVDHILPGLQPLGETRGPNAVGSAAGR